MAMKYRSEDADMDFFFVVALGWSTEGGLSGTLLMYAMP